MSFTERWNGAAWEVVGPPASGAASGLLPAYASAPASPQLGQSYFDSTLNQQRIWNGTSWTSPSSSYGQQLAIATFTSVYSTTVNNGVLQSGPLALAITVPAGYNYFLETEALVGVNLQAPNALAAGTDIYFGYGIQDQTLGTIICSDIWRDQVYSGQGAVAVKYRQFRTGLYVASTAAQHTYQVMMGGSASLSTNFPQLYTGSALLGYTGPAWIRAVSC